ncbi:endothelin-converting enzyme homolog [Tribolium castaneum]|uniref:endothelin-converting enzyme homolog n=1 Tax=Tribolium castaneum TaxID=7070 RepID=UPI00077D9A25|nr:PREDICTED: endothelin-converting enzyme 1-like [Tribolium castaneum]|eukprot:XP_015837315.1 PREDICTED: endothelin-converting enzyme 1-like [Tribolium castaneum]
MECWTRRSRLEKKSCVTLILVLTVTITLITLILLVTEPQFCVTLSCVESSKIMNKMVDPRKNPCEDFHAYVCGKSQSPRDDSQRVLKEVLSEGDKVNDTASLKLQKQFYHSCNDLKAIDMDNDTTFAHLIAKLGGWPVVSGNNWNESAFDFAEFMVNLRELGFQYDWFLDVSVYSNLGENIILEINVPDNVNKIEEKDEQNYADLMVDVAMAFGAHKSVAKSQIPEVVYLERKLANLVDEIQTENEELAKQKSFHLLTVAEVQQKWQKLNWLEFLNHITQKKLSDTQLVAFYVESYMPKLDKLLKQTTKRTQVNYVIWKLIETFSPYLSKPIRDLMQNYSIKANETETWYQDRSTFCFEESKSFFQYSLEAEFVRRYVTATKRRNVEELIERILTHLEEHFRDSKWLDFETRKAAIYKIQNISYIIGGPEEMYYDKQFDKDFGIGELEFNSSNIIHINMKLFEKGLDLLFNKKYKETNYLKYTFYELVPSREIRFMQRFNLIWVPAGALHGYLYEDTRPNYLNYGTLGTTIAQQLIEAMYFSILRNVSEVTFSNFKNMTHCLPRCGSDSELIDCNESLITIMSNYLAVDIAYLAYKRWEKQNFVEKNLHGLHFSGDQLFWLAYGTSMCHEINPTDTIQSSRIVGPLRNSLYFSKVFKCDQRNKCLIL